MSDEHPEYDIELVDEDIEATQPVRVPLGITPGRCGSCRFLERHELPTRDVFFCRRLVKEMTPEQKDEVHGCPVWEDEELPQVRMSAEEGVRARDLYEDTDSIHSELRDALARHGVDIKTLMLLANPGLRTLEQLAWVDELDKTPCRRSLMELADLADAAGSSDLAALVRIAAERLGLIR